MGEEYFWDKLEKLIVAYKYKGDDRTSDIEAHKIFSQIKSLIANEIEEQVKNASRN